MADVMSLASRVIRELASHLMKEAFADKPLLAAQAQQGLDVRFMHSILVCMTTLAEGFFPLRRAVGGLSRPLA
jgi:hypothetical protein